MERIVLENERWRESETETETETEAKRKHNGTNEDVEGWRGAASSRT
jgi:hypothetical protein